jgi:ribosomal protein S18 acetylase RimI-like enzyme
MIRILTPDDAPGILPVWGEAFGDSPEYILSFLEQVGSVGIGLGYFSAQQTLDSLLWLLPCTFDHLQAYYVFAVCTAGHARGQGFARKVLDAAKEYAAKNDSAALLLYPAEESLCDYYAKQGFVPTAANTSISFPLVPQHFQEDLLPDWDKSQLFIFPIDKKAHLLYN